jgi:hypothetical protein
MGESRMTLAMKRLKNIGWLALVFTVAVLLYPLSLNVAALHSDLVQMDRKILDTKREISFLQAEIRTRASVAQLEQWNDLLYGYQPPSAEQFIDGERGLASLGGSAPTVKPVMVAVANVDGAAPAGEVGEAGAAASNIIGSSPARDKPAVERIEQKREDKPEMRRVAVVDREIAKPQLQPQAKPREAVSDTKPRMSETKKPKVESRTERLAKMDDKLLSDTVLRDIEKTSAKERKRQ